MRISVKIKQFYLENKKIVEEDDDIFVTKKDKSRVLDRQYSTLDACRESQTDNPYANTTFLSNESKKLIIIDCIRFIRRKTKKYYKYTNCRMLPEDIYLLCMYKREANVIGYDMRGESNISIGKIINPD